MTSGPRISALVLWCEKLDECVSFYKALGLPLEHEDHEGGPVHYACDYGGAHFALYAAREGSTSDARRFSAGATTIGLSVPDVRASFNQAVQKGASVIWEPREMPWGLAAQVTDPDGRPVELNQI